jgi:hypothetical protein
VKEGDWRILYRDYDLGLVEDGERAPMVHTFTYLPQALDLQDLWALQLFRKDSDIYM